jgi:DNA-binding transcriptional MerR regulator
MMTVHEVSKLTGVSIRTLQYYDNIGLLKPANYSESGYRLYDDTDMERLQQILLFKELEFPLKEIKTIIDSSDFDKKKALNQQIKLLELKKEHLENLISFARNLKKKGADHMDFTAFDTSKIDEYSKKAKEQWGSTEAYKEYETKFSGRSKDETSKVMNDFMEIFAKFGKIKDGDPSSEASLELVQNLKNFISEHFYTCTDEILEGLGQGYVGGNEFTKNIDKAGGAGTAEFVNKAILAYVGK